MKLLSKIPHKVFLLLVCCILQSCSSTPKQTNSITVFAAASLTDVMTEIASQFKKETGYSVRLNFASSGILARQIENGAHCDYYLSASKEWMDYLDTLQYVDRNSIHSHAGNRIVAIVPVDNKKMIIDSVTIVNFPQLFEGRISLGDPNHVPAGKYAMQMIEKYGWIAELKHRLLPAKNVRDALFMVEMGEVEMGIVYASDAHKSDKVRVVYEFSGADCDPIRYYGASCPKPKKAVGAFLEFLQTDQVKLVWAKNGFRID
ncbi:molybdate ABC transporter substrate-binding protein [Labilibaculum sp.]|uniref:molybdate ABC transporter substrate-binding protein n=1 Tax=Labilibaculum sp. TaxID=2060723 RepID=UPI003565F229